MVNSKSCYRNVPSLDCKRMLGKFENATKKLIAIEHHIYALLTLNNTTVSLRKQVEQLVAATQEFLKIQDDSQISSVLESIAKTFSTTENLYGDVDTFS